jgi:hypothetical protein
MHGAGLDSMLIGFRTPAQRDAWTMHPVALDDLADDAPGGGKSPLWASASLQSTGFGHT